jgi:hypothetical protein
MEITIRARKLKRYDSWEHKCQGVVLVEKEEDIEPLFEHLVAHDDYWKSYKDLIRVAPKEIDNEGDIKRMCGYVGKTDIDDAQLIREQSGIDFILFQYRECYE